MSEKEEKDVDEVEVDEVDVEGERWRESLPPVRRRQKKREELPAGWERHEVSWGNEIFSRSELGQILTGGSALTL